MPYHHLRRRGLHAVATLALLALAPSSFAQTVKCGLFVSEAGSSKLQLEAPDRGRELSDYDSDKAFALQLIVGQLSLVNLRFGLISTVMISRTGRELSVDDRHYRLSKPAQCQAVIPHPEGSCLADPAGCLTDLHDKGVAELETGCAEGVPALCSRLVEKYRQLEQSDEDGGLSEMQIAAARAYMEKAMAEIDIPASCRDGSEHADEAACLKVMEASPELVQKVNDALLGASAAAGMVGVLSRTSQPPLSPKHLANLLAFCEQTKDGDFCTEVAQQHWDANKLVDATSALALACTGGSSSACAMAPALQQLEAELVPQAAETIPCGEYVSQRALMDTLSFGDRGLVKAGFGQLRARVEEGAIRIRHEQGGDFVLRQLPNGDLLGMDEWTRFQRFERQPDQGGSARCMPPVDFNEVPLVQDCPKALVDGGAEACCTSGKLQGCNVLGTRLGLNGQWQQAADQYLKVCRAGIREGCENLVSVQENSSAVDAHSMLQELCQADSSGRHVACDLLETRNWSLMAVGSALQRALEKTIRDEGMDVDADEDAAPRTKTPNHK